MEELNLTRFVSAIGYAWRAENAGKKMFFSWTFLLYKCLCKAHDFIHKS